MGEMREMRRVLGLSGGASSSEDAGVGGGGGAAAAAAAAEEEEAQEGVEENDEEEEEEELELGLSLRAKSLAPLKSAPRGLGCRILTAKDLPPLTSRASPLTSPRSSAASSSSSAAAAGSKRAKADNNPSPEAVGSAHPPSQVVVGWPPIRAFRMNSLVNLSNKDHTPQEANVGAGKESNADFSVKDVHAPKSGGKMQRASASPFVKVYMDGDPIGRKVDLSAHHSYKSLALSLEFMFHNPTLPFPASIINGATASKLLDGSYEFALTYEDREGDCMLVGDVPWGMFLGNAKRLRIMRTSDAGRLAPRFHSNNSIGSIAKVGPEASSLKRR